MSERIYWFLAINGPSCAACNFPASERIQVSPRPEFVIGFVSQKRQLEMQQKMLTCAPEKLPNVFREIAVDRICGDAVVRKFGNPEAYTKGVTMWIDPPEKQP